MPVLDRPCIPSPWQAPAPPPWTHHGDDNLIRNHASFDPHETMHCNVQRCASPRLETQSTLPAGCGGASEPQGGGLLGGGLFTLAAAAAEFLTVHLVRVLFLPGILAMHMSTGALRAAQVRAICEP